MSRITLFSRLVSKPDRDWKRRRVHPDPELRLGVVRGFLCGTAARAAPHLKQNEGDHMPGFTLKDYDDVEGIAIDAFALSRDCVTGLRVDVLPNLPPRERPRVESLLADIEARRIFEQKTINQLEGVIETISRRILDGTDEVAGFVADECHVDGGALDSKRLRTEAANDLARALPLLLGLRDSVYAVHDAMHAIHAVDKLRAARNRSGS